MLAYVFWHRPRDGADQAAYEARLRAFHRVLSLPSASFRLSVLPFDEGAGYEDWYLVDDWSQLGELNRAAISGGCHAPHEAIAAVSGAGWGGVYALIRGHARPPMTARWTSKPGGEGYDVFLNSLRAPTVWQRQMVLGPAPEFCVVDDAHSGSADVDRIPVYAGGH
jgi:hypothetical protein